MSKLSRKEGEAQPNMYCARLQMLGLFKMNTTSGKCGGH